MASSGSRGGGYNTLFFNSLRVVRNNVSRALRTRQRLLDECSGCSKHLDSINEERIRIQANHADIFKSLPSLRSVSLDKCKYNLTYLLTKHWIEVTLDLIESFTPSGPIGDDEVERLRDVGFCVKSVNQVEIPEAENLLDLAKEFAEASNRDHDCF